MHEDELQQIGLTEKEAKVYLATLALGKATALEISKKTGLKRPTAYFTVDSLMKKGLMSSVYEGKKQYFMAEIPERLVDVFEARQDEVRRQGEKLKKLIPDLKQLRPKTDGGPVVKYYTGKEGAISMVKSLAEQADDRGVWILYPHDTVEQHLTQEERTSIQFHRANPVVEVHAFYSSSETELPQKPHMHRIRITANETPITADIAVYGNVVRLTSFNEEPVGIVIDNPDIAETMRTLFKLAWRNGENRR